MLQVPNVPKGQEILGQGPFSSPQVLMINDDLIPQLIRKDGQILLNKVPQLVLQIQGLGELQTQPQTRIVAKDQNQGLQQGQLHQPRFSSRSELLVQLGNDEVNGVYTIPA